MPLSSVPFIAAATAMAKEIAMSAYAGWRAFFFLKKLASDDWRWTELAQMFALYLEHSPDARADLKRMAVVALGGVLVFLAAHAGITYCVWREKSSAIRARLVVQAGCITALNGNNAVLNGRLAAQTGRIAALTGSLDEAEDTISILLEQGWQGREVSPVVASRSRRRDEEAANSGVEGGERAEKTSGLSTGGVESVLKTNIASPHAVSVSSGHGHRHGDKRCKESVGRTRALPHLFVDRSSNASRGIVKYEVLRQSTLRATASEGTMAPPRTTGRAAKGTTIHDIAAASSSSASSFEAKDVALPPSRLRADARADQKGRRKPQGPRGDQACRTKERCRDATASPVPASETVAIERMESGVRTRSLHRVFDTLSHPPHGHNTVKHQPPFQRLCETALKETVRRERPAIREVSQADAAYDIPVWV